MSSTLSCSFFFGNPRLQRLFPALLGQMVLRWLLFEQRRWGISKGRWLHRWIWGFPVFPRCWWHCPDHQSQPPRNAGDHGHNSRILRLFVHLGPCVCFFELLGYASGDWVKAGTWASGKDYSFHIDLIFMGSTDEEYEFFCPQITPIDTDYNALSLQE